MSHRPGDLLARAAEAATQAYCPYSSFRVGAALLASDGHVFPGCNVENASFGLTVCAERNALFAAVAAGHRQFAALAIVADGEAPPYPCGACRQVLAEFCAPDFPVYVQGLSQPDDFEHLVLGDLLPRAFNFPRSP
jgi:cytidine deaminase